MTAKAKKKTNVEWLVAARKLIADPAHWTKRSFFAWDESGEPRAFCALGALRWVGAADLGLKQPLLIPLAPSEFLVASISGKSTADVVAFNDSHDHKAVLAMYDRAIRLAKQDAARKAKKGAAR